MFDDTRGCSIPSYPLVGELLEGGEVLAHVDVHVSIKACDGGKHLAPNAQLQGQSVPRQGHDMS